MRMGDIQADGVYSARVGWRRSAKVRVVATQVQYKARGGFGTDGVRVQLEQSVSGYSEWWEGSAAEASVEITVRSRDIEREWTQEDQDAYEAACALVVRQSRIEELLGRAGYAGVDGAFAWRGAGLEVRGELLDYLMGLLADAEGVDRGAVV